MDPVIIALICAASFGVVVALSVFIRQLLLSRDKKLNDEAQKQALAQETEDLKEMRKQMQSSQRFVSHYDVLGDNKNSIRYIDDRIEAILNKKVQLIDSLSQEILKESAAIVEGQYSVERRALNEQLRAQREEEIRYYDKELEHFQKERAALWDTHADVQESLINQEQLRNKNLDEIYKQHTGLMEKIYLRHEDEREHVVQQSIEAGTASFKEIIMAPIQFLMRFFGPSTGISIGQVQIEKAARDEVTKAEDEINDKDPMEVDEEDKKDEDLDDFSEDNEEGLRISIV